VSGTGRGFESPARTQILTLCAIPPIPETGINFDS